MDFVIISCLLVQNSKMYLDKIIKMYHLYGHKIYSIMTSVYSL